MSKQIIARAQVTINTLQDGQPGLAGVDANLLDWVKEWNTNKTIIGAESLITPKIFAGIKNLNGTVTGIALGKYQLSVINSSGDVITESINGIYGFKDGYRTFSVDTEANVQLGNGTQFIKYNSSTGKVEFGEDVALNWIGATYINREGIFTGTISATTIHAFEINASQITTGTIDSARINVELLKAELITADNIESLTLNVAKGKIGGWHIDSDAIFSGTKNNADDEYTTDETSVTIGTYGIRGNKWKFDTSGAGALAGGNISWDTTGNVTFDSSVSLNWMNPLSNINDALGGTTYPKLTLISSEGIYTGTLNASQITAGTISADCIGAGSITSTKLDAGSIKAEIINTDYINGLSCTFTHGKIGGWDIEAESLVITSSDISMQLRSVSTGSDSWHDGKYKPYGLSLLWNQDQNAGHIVFGQVAASATTVKDGFLGLQMMGSDDMEYFCLSANHRQSGSKEIYNRIAGWAFDHTHIWKNNVSLDADGSIMNGLYWQLNNDGSGQLANGNISWSASGTVTFDASVTLNWTNPIDDITEALGGTTYAKLTQITATGIYTGVLNADQITTGVLNADRIEAGSINASKLDASSIKAHIINTDYINGLDCNFVRGKIGGWTIAGDAITVSTIGAVGTTPVQIRPSTIGSGYVYSGQCRPFGLTMTWYQNLNAGHFVFGQVMASGNTVKTGYIGLQMMSWDNQEFFCLSTNFTKSGSKEIYNRIGGWGFDSTRIWKNSVSLSADGSITNGNFWQINNNGSGRLANGNISWDAAGNVTFSSSVSLNWTSSINSINSKLTQISAAGIYTGKISAGQINVDTALIVGGSSYNGNISVRDASNNVKVTLDRNGINAVGGTIAGWSISASQISRNSVVLGSDGSITNGTRWKLNNDGSGQVANGNVSWTAAGVVSITGTVNATSGKIGGFTISGNKLVNTAANSAIEFSSLSGSSNLSINGSTTILLNMRADSARTAIAIQTYASGAKGMYIVANAGSIFAIESYGPHRFGQRSGESWNTPGVLYSAVVKNSNTLYNQWGNGMTVTSFSKAATGIFVVKHNLNHTQYTVVATTYWDTGTNYHSNAYVRLEYISANSFQLRVVNCDNGGLVDTCFTFAVIGRNNW